jgi:hypothetical protein
VIEAVSPSLKKEEEQIGDGRCQGRLDPKEYLHARRKLKKAVLEHYRRVSIIFPTVQQLIHSLQWLRDAP